MMFHNAMKSRPLVKETPFWFDGKLVQSGTNIAPSDGLAGSGRSLAGGWPSPSL